MTTGEFGTPARFQAGDVVGFGLDMITGEGYCTLNGRRLSMGKEPETDTFLIFDLC